MTPTEGQTTTHSSADVLSTRRFAMKAVPCGVSMEEVDPDARGFVYYLCSDIDPAVAALIARNAELEAVHKAQISEDDMLSAIEDSAICLENWGELHEARDLRRATYTLIAERDALAAENKALREDAERYRWLREQHWYEAPLAVVVRPKDSVKLGHECPSLDRLDAAIDDARTPAKENDDG